MHTGGETGRRVSPLWRRRDFWRFFYTRGVLQLQSCLSRIELLLSKLHYIMLLLRLHDVTILREVAFRSIIHESESKNKWRKLAYVKRVEATTSPCITHRKRQNFLQNPVIRATQFYLALQRKTAQVRDQLSTTYPMCKIQALSCNKMRVLAAPLDFPNAACAKYLPTAWVTSLAVQRVFATYRKTQPGRGGAWGFTHWPARRITTKKLQLRSR